MFAVSAAHAKKGPFLAIFTPSNLQPEIPPPPPRLTVTDLNLKNTLTINVGKQDEGERKNLWENAWKGA